MRRFEIAPNNLASGSYVSALADLPMHVQKQQLTCLFKTTRYYCSRGNLCNEDQGSVYARKSGLN